MIDEEILKQEFSSVELLFRVPITLCTCTHYTSFDR